MLIYIRNNSRCSIDEKLDMIPEGELKPKLQTHATLPTGFNKRISDVEITSTSRSSSNVGLVSSTNIQKPSKSPSRSLLTKAKSKKKRIRSIPKAKYVDKTSDEDDHNNNNENIDGSFPPPIIGARVWAMYQGARRAGKVLSVNDKHGIFKMRFDDCPTAEFDYSFAYNSPVWSYIEGLPPPASTTSTEFLVSSVKTCKNENEQLLAIAEKFKILVKVKFESFFSLVSNTCFYFIFSLCYHLIVN